MVERKPIHFDANAGSGVPGETREQLERIGFDYLNPSSIHQGGQRARAIIEDARDALADLINADNKYRIVFTSGATEANNTIISSAILDCQEGSVVTSQLEHPSVLEPFRRAEQRGIAVRYLSYEEFLDPSRVLEVCSTETKLCSLMSANNETGDLFPVSECFRQIKSAFPSVITHSDAVQSAGKIHFDVDAVGADAYSFSGHKFGALSGIGALVYKNNLKVESLLCGGPQELGARAGTENVIGILSLGLAAKLAKKNLSVRAQDWNRQRNSLVSEMTSALPDMKIYSDLNNSLANTVSVSIPGVAADDLVIALDLQGVYVSSGAACSSGKPNPSHVLLAMGKTELQARETLRISLAADLHDSDVTRGTQIIIETVKNIRQKKASGCHTDIQHHIRG